MRAHGLPAAVALHYPLRHPPPICPFLLGRAPAQTPPAQQLYIPQPLRVLRANSGTPERVACRDIKMRTLAIGIPLTAALAARLAQSHQETRGFRIGPMAACEPQAVFTAVYKKS